MGLGLKRAFGCRKVHSTAPIAMLPRESQSLCRAFRETFLSNAVGGTAICTIEMEKADPSTSAPVDAQEGTDADLARRLARYRRRVEAEGRPRSVKRIDRAIADAAKPRKQKLE